MGKGRTGPSPENPRMGRVGGSRQPSCPKDAVTCQSQGPQQEQKTLKGHRRHCLEVCDPETLVSANKGAETPSPRTQFRSSRHAEVEVCS